MTNEKKEPQATNDAVAVNIAALNAELSEVKAERDALKGACAKLTTELKEAAAKIESDSRELMYPAISAKLSITRAELDAMPLQKVRDLRETAARVATASAPHGKLNLVTSADAVVKGGVPDLYGKTSKEIAEIVKNL